MRQSSSYLKLKDYFRNLVEQSHFINDFSGYFARELHNKQSSFNNFQSPCLALFGYSMGMDGEDLSNVAVRKMNFGIIFNDIPPDDFESQYTAIDKAEALAIKVVARMRLDSNNPNHFLHTAFIKNSVEITPVELDGVGLFGVEVSFQIKNIQSLSVNPDDWKDINKVC